MTTSPPPSKQKNTTAPVLRFKWQDWLPYLEDADLTDDQKREFIETMWSIILGFVDLGFDLNPPAKNCGEELDLRAVLEAAVLSSDNTQNTDGKEDAA